MLSVAVRRHVHLRADARDRGDDASLAAYNANLSGLRLIISELDRTASEMGWEPVPATPVRVLLDGEDVTDKVDFVLG